MGRQDVFPFYDWNLFAFVPRLQTKIAVRVHELNGERIEPGELEFRHRDRYSGRDSFLIPHQIHRFGRSLTEADPKNPILRAEMERNLFHGHRSAVYSVTVLQADIRELLRGAEPRVVRVLGEFHYNGEAGDDGR